MIAPREDEMQPLPDEPLEGLIYLASPYSHPDPAVMEWRFCAISQIAAQLTRDGWMVYSPIVHSHPISQYGLPTNWEFWEQYDHMFLELCSGMIVAKLDGWDISRGVRAELEYARTELWVGDEISSSVFFLDPPPSLMGGVGEKDATVLDEAKRLVFGDRQEAYGHPFDDLTCQAEIATAILKRKGYLKEGAFLIAEDMALIMNGVKMSREAGRPKRDNRVDGPGYWEVCDLCVQERTRRAEEAKGKD